MPYRVYYTPQAIEGWEAIKKDTNLGLRLRAEKLVQRLADDPLSTDSPYVHLSAEFEGVFVRRIGAAYRIIYKIESGEQVVKVLYIGAPFDPKRTT